MTPTAEPPRMSAYGLDPADWSPLPWSWASERLVANRNYWVGTVSPDGRPHSMPVWGTWDTTSDTFGFSCASQSLKAANLARNPAVVITVDDTVECVSVEADAAPLDEGRLERFIELWVAKYAEPGGEAEMAEFLRSGNSTFECTPRVAFGVIEREDEFATRATRWRFGG